ncbi:NAD(P)/FAD-dependent oxidoreductase [Rubritalea marina]|uniref:NAD(P)/FAD-dependent oxidoreductase n=1 Tax=Rubritalea marina TaxID=361055 RepID=UPI00037226D4|nr:FAD-dependent monooxygenase [Rubritalea marina]
MREITIVGGGLAGLSLGLYLRRHEVPVVLHEAGQYPQHKVCGEFICGASDEVLGELGVMESMGDAIIHQSMRWSVGQRQVLERAMPSPARGISRHTLDQRLALRLEEAGATVLTGSKFRGARDAEGCIWASGKVKSAGKQWIGLKAHFRVEDIEGLEMHVGDAGYIGLCRVDVTAVNVCGLFAVQPQIKGKGAELLLRYIEANGLLDLAQRLRCSSYCEGSFTATAGFQLGRQARDAGVGIGDSLNLIPPFTGNGMSMALETSYLIAPLVRDYARGSLNWGELEQAYAAKCRSLFSTRMRLASSLHPLLFKRFSRQLMGQLLRFNLLPIDPLFTQLRNP